ncbi:hypothetical protein ACEPAG_3836 [Sanghuangporus baumii]
MPITYGTLDWDSEDNIVATFAKINKVFVQVESSTSETISKDVRDAPMTEPMTIYGKLTYNGLDELTSTRSYVGSIGDLTYTVVFDNGPVIEGMANQPGVMPLIGISGSGFWKDIKVHDTVEMTEVTK